MPSIFLSYRRSDSMETTGRIYDRLKDAFEADSVFRDIDSIPLGLPFPQVLEQTLSRADVVLVIIGPTWVSATDATGNRRLDDVGDFVRMEVEYALRHQIPVIPVLVGNARMPLGDELPIVIRDLLCRNNYCIRPDPDFHSDVNKLTKKLDEITCFNRIEVPRCYACNNPASSKCQGCGEASCGVHLEAIDVHYTVIRPIFAADKVSTPFNKQLLCSACFQKLEEIRKSNYKSDIKALFIVLPVLLVLFMIMLIVPHMQRNRISEEKEKRKELERMQRAQQTAQQTDLGWFTIPKMSDISQNHLEEPDERVKYYSDLIDDLFNADSEKRSEAIKQLYAAIRKKKPDFELGQAASKKSQLLGMVAGALRKRQERVLSSSFVLSLILYDRLEGEEQRRYYSSPKREPPKDDELLLEYVNGIMPEPNVKDKDKHYTLLYELRDTHCTLLYELRTDENVDIRNAAEAAIERLSRTLPM